MSGGRDGGNMPWVGWKWVIPFYISCLVNAVTLLVVYFVSIATDGSFLIFTGNDNLLVWDMLPTLPVIFFLIEYPFNMIPFDGHMVIFPQVLFVIYLLINFILSLFNEDLQNTYQAFNWFHTPLRSLISCLISLILVSLVFTGFYFLTNKCKLPRYSDRSRRLFESIVSDMGSDVSPADVADRNK